MKNVIIVADWFEGSQIDFSEFLVDVQDFVECVYFKGKFYSVEQTLSYIQTS